MRHLKHSVCGLSAALLLALACSLSIAAEAGFSYRPTGSPGDARHTDRLIVRLRDGGTGTGKAQPMSADKVRALSGAAAVELTHLRVMASGAHVMQLPRSMDLQDVRAAAALIAADPDVEYAEPDGRRYTRAVTPNDSSYQHQFYLNDPLVGINAPTAWGVTQGSNNIRVAVLDTGILFNHTDLIGRTISGYDFIGADPAPGNGVAVAPGWVNGGTNYLTAGDNSGRDPDPTDPGDYITAQEANLYPYQGCAQSASDWHGTHVAGIIGAAANNNSGIAGINWVSKVLPLRVLGKCGGYVSDIVDAIYWASGASVPGVPNNTNPAQVINMSLGGSEPTCSASEASAIASVLAGGTVKAVVTAAGNEGVNASGSAPGNCPGVINVAAIIRSGNLASYSNYGVGVSISAPGGDTNSANFSPCPGGDNILSTGDSGTTTAAGDSRLLCFAGTSSAAPQVTGAISLLLSSNPNLTPARVKALLQATARPFLPGTNCNTTLCGAGMLDVGAAMLRLSDTFLVSPAQLNFGTVAAGASQSQVFTVSNFSNSGLTITSAIVSPSVSGVSKTADGCTGATLPSGGQCTVTMTYAPATSGSASTTNLVVTSGSSGQRSVAVTGAAGAVGSGGGGGGNNGGGTTASSGGGGCTTGGTGTDATLLLLLAAATGTLARRAARRRA